MGIYTQDVQKLYIAYFNRPADTLGLAYWEAQAAANGSTAAVANAFSASQEYKDLYAGKSSAAIVDAIYQNLFARAAEPAGLTYWGTRLDNGTFNIGNIVTAVMTGAQGADITTVTNKASAADAFTTALDTSAEIIAYSGTAANTIARTWLATVTSDTATLTAATTGLATVTASVVSGSTASAGSTFTLTAGVDAVTGTANNDTINASLATISGTGVNTLGGLDVIDGGAGTDTLNVADTLTIAGADFSFPAGISIKNVENVAISTNAAVGTGITSIDGSGVITGGTALDVSGFTGLTSITAVAAGTGTANGSYIKAANTTDVNVIVAGNNSATVTGGKAVSIVSGATGTGIDSVVGAALTTVSVKGGGVLAINNFGGIAGTTSATGTTLTSVTLDGIAGATSTIQGAALTSLTLQNQKVAHAVTITNDTSTALTINTNGVGYDATGAAVTDSVAAGSKAATINVNATGTKSNLTVTAAAAKTLNITGDAALTLAPIATVTKLDGSAATGNLTLGTLNAVTVDIKTGSGNDTFTADTTSKQSIVSGAGNDSVTLSGALVAGSTVTLGAGDDHLIGTTAVATSLTATSVIDGGDGVDTVSAQLINAGNASLFKNFEGLSLNSTAGLDVALLTGNTITSLYIDSASTSAAYQNVTQTMGLTVNFVGDNSAVTNTLTMTGVTGTSDSYTITFAGDNSAATTAPTVANVKAGTVAAAGIENINIVSGGTKAWNSMTLGADTSAKTVVVTGAANLDLAFAAGFGSTTSPQTGVSSIDGSAATGKLAITLANVVQATAGLTVKGGSAADTFITSTGETTLTGGAGADTFDAQLAVSTAGAAAVLTTIADAASGDIIKLTGAGTAAFTSTKVDVNTATALSGGTVNALDLASTADGSTDNQVKWFQFGGNTYVIDHVTNSTTAYGTGDQVVKIVGLVDLSTAAFVDGGTFATLTLA